MPTPKELQNLKLRIEQNREIEQFLRSKFTGTALYTWMSSELAAEHYRAYSLAYDLAKRAERAFQLERANPGLSFISFGYWDNLKKGLLAGDRLLRDLRIMDAAYLADARRDLEVTKHVSLAALDATKLIQLRDTGETTFTVPEVEFDADYPSHYLRRLKTVALSVPVAVPPEEGVRAELTLRTSTFRRSTALVDGNYGSVAPGDERFVVDHRAHLGLVTSTGQSDPGMFEVNLRDELLLPFEGAGADSEWHLSIPKETNAFPLHEISDVVLHLRYTAKDGGSILKTKAKEAVSTATTAGERVRTRIFDVQNELPDVWEQFVRGTNDPITQEVVQQIAIPFSSAHVKRLFGGTPLKVVQVTLSATFASKYSPPTIAGESLTFSVTPPSGTGGGTIALPFLQGEPSIPLPNLSVSIPPSNEATSWKLRFTVASTNVPGTAFTNGLLRGDVFERLFVVFHYAGGAS